MKGLPNFIPYTETHFPSWLRDSVKAERICTNSVPTQPDEVSEGRLLRIQ